MRLPSVRQALFLSLVGLTACSELFEKFDMQADVREMGDAMEHCQRFMDHLLTDDVQIFVDKRSTRETIEHYDIYFHLYDEKQEGWAQCRVNMRGEITHHAIRDFRMKGRSFQ